MVGVELADKAVTDAVCAACLAAGVIVLACGPDENVLRLVPPLTVSDDEIDQGLAVLVDAVRGVSD
jgi:4-aminobutyrate aminotransferase-like enzyme